MLLRRLIPLGLLVAGCGMNPGTTWFDALANPDWFPLGQGSTWTYRVTRNDLPAGRVVTEIVAARPDGDATTAALAATYDGLHPNQALTATTRYRRSADQLLAYAGADPVLELRLPAEQGMTWTSAIGDRAGAVVGLEPLSIPAGAWLRTLHVRLRHGDSWEDRWYVVGLGLVGARWEDGVRRWELKLETYSLANLASAEPVALPPGDARIWFPPVEVAPGLTSGPSAAPAAACEPSK